MAEPAPGSALRERIKVMLRSGMSAEQIVAHFRSVKAGRTREADREALAQVPGVAAPPTIPPVRAEAAPAPLSGHVAQAPINPIEALIRAYTVPEPDPAAQAAEEFARTSVAALPPGSGRELFIERPVPPKARLRVVDELSGTPSLSLPPTAVERATARQPRLEAPSGGTLIVDAVKSLFHDLTGIPVTMAFEGETGFDPANFTSLVASFVTGPVGAVIGRGGAGSLRAIYSTFSQLSRNSPLAAKIFKAATNPKFASRVGGAAGASVPFATQSAAEVAASGEGLEASFKAAGEEVLFFVALGEAGHLAARLVPPAARAGLKDIFAAAEDVARATFDLTLSGVTAVHAVGKVATGRLVEGPAIRARASAEAAAAYLRVLNSKTDPAFMQLFRRELATRLDPVLKQAADAGTPLRRTEALAKAAFPPRGATTPTTDATQAAAAAERGFIAAEAAKTAAKARSEAKIARRAAEISPEGPATLPKRRVVPPTIAEFTPEEAADVARLRQPIPAAPPSAVPSKADRARLLRERAAVAKARKRGASPIEAAEEGLVEGSRPEREELIGLLNDDDLYDDIFYPGRARKPVNLTAPSAPGPRTSTPNLADARAELAEKGLNLTIEESLLPAAPGTKPQPFRRFRVRDQSGNDIGTTELLSDALELAKRRASTAGSVLAGEGLNAFALADEEDDDPATRKLKLALRSGIRAAEVLALTQLGAPVRRPLTRMRDSLERRAAESGFKQRFTEEWRDARTSVVNAWFKLRPPDDLARRYPDLRDPLLRFGISYRALQAERRALRNRLFVDWWRKGFRKHSARDIAAADLINAIDLKFFSRLPVSEGPGSLARWRKAVNESFTGDRHVSEAARDRALDALNRSDNQVFSRVKEAAEIYRNLRFRSEQAESVRFAEALGRAKPFIVTEANGTFRGRYANQRTAERAAARIKPGGEGLSITHQPAPTPEELEKRLGPPIRAYLTHIYDNLDRQRELRGLIEAAPWADPNEFVAELTRLINLPHGNTAVRGSKRAAWEEAFGTLDNSEYKALIRNGIRLLAQAAESGGRISTANLKRGIPEELYVRFYERRRGADGFVRSLVGALEAYVPSVLRDIHLGPHLPLVERALENARVAGRVNPGVLSELEGYITDALGRNRPFAPALERYSSMMTAWAYGAALWGRITPAMNNVIGQMLLVGQAEVGPEAGIAALVALADPGVRKALSQHALVQSALPFGETAVKDLLGKLRQSDSRSETAKIIFKDFGTSAFDFLALSEGLIRNWAFMAGTFESLNRRGLAAPLVGRGAQPSAAGLRQFLSNWDRLDPTVRDAVRLDAEDAVRRVAFFFESATMPSAFRAIKNIPIIGPPITMFTNFPANYTSRFISNVADAFSTKVPTQLRSRAQGALLRLHTATLLLVGPAGLPVIDILVNETSDFDPGLGGTLRRFLNPYQDWWRTFWAGRDTSKFSVTAPVTDLFDRLDVARTPIIGAFAQANRADLLPALTKRAAGAFGLTLPIDGTVTEEIRAERQRALGGLTPYLTDEPAPPTDATLVPELLNSLVLGGGAIADWLNFAHTVASKGGAVPGPLDLRGRLRTLEDPVARITLGRSEADVQARATAKLIRDQDSAARATVRRFIEVLVSDSPNPREFSSAIREISRNPGLFARADETALEASRRVKQRTPEERALLTADKAVIERLWQRGVFNQLLRNIDSLPQVEAQRRVRVYIAAVAARAAD